MTEHLGDPEGYFRWYFVDFYYHTAKYKPFSHRNTMRVFIGSTLQLLGTKQKNHFVKNVIFNYYMCTDNYREAYFLA